MARLLIDRRCHLKRFIVYAGLFLVVLVNYIDRVNLSVAAGPLRKALDLSAVQLGYIFSSFSWTYIIFLIPLGRLVDRWGAAKALPAALAVWSLGGVMTGFSGSYAGLLVSRLVLGAGEAVTYPAGARVIRDWVPREERGFAQALMSSGQMFGPAFGAIFVGWLVASFGWELSFIISGGLGFVLAAAWFLIYHQPEDASWLDQAEKTRILAGRDISKNQSKDSGPAQPVLGSFLRSPTMWALAFVQGCGIYLQYLFVNWLPTYLQSSNSMGIMSASALTAIPYLFAGVTVISLAKLSDRILSRKTIANGGRRLVIAGCLCLAAIILVTPFMSSFWLILGVISVSLGCAASATSMNLALANDLLRNSNHAGIAASFVIFGGNLFGAFAPVITGYAISSTYGFKGAFVIAGILLVLGSIVCALLTRDPIDQQSEAEPVPAPAI
ncbi:MFS transporter [Bradyrhizobium canariense]|uniref:MFS transporter, ACS family, glucarate transporter n=1 Tax=Bradyrhizobium canariense TaxID=255045 RepID=A0A1H1ZKR5_9BRAD|nr:MFS transporter [Bradyrhizobium canariense]SDT34243.1 MFS transporter, ACS family, glucarate transporter [Bradyrhizobium canariense]